VHESNQEGEHSCIDVFGVLINFYLFTMEFQLFRQWWYALLYFIAQIEVSHVAMRKQSYHTHVLDKNHERCM
jgi:hypothetical protein